MASSVAQSLPLDVLLLICRLSAADHPTLFAHGGKLPSARWDSHETAAPLALVCKKWHAAANAVLYESVAVLGGEQARLLLRTLRRRPLLGRAVRWLVIGLADREDAEATEESSDQDVGAGRDTERSSMESEDAAKADSASLAEVLDQCSAVEHLQLRRALHQDSRDQVLPILVSRNYITLICAPRWLSGDGCEWTKYFHQPEDIVRLVRPSLQSFEFEFLFPSEDGRDENDRIKDALDQHPLPQTLPNLRGLRLDGGVPPAALELILSRTTGLEVLTVYTERVISANKVLGQLSQEGAAAMKRLRFLVNPRAGTNSPPPPASPPPNHSFLSTLTSLHSAVLSSKELASSTFLRATPPSLRTLEILCFAHTFPFHPRMLVDLQDQQLELGLHELKVLDSRETWTVEEVRDVGEACEARGIRFTWEPGHAESESSGSSDRRQSGQFP